MNLPRRRIRLLAASLAAAFFAAAPSAQASPATVLRATSNLVFSPIDLVLSPVVAARGVYTNMQDIDDSTGVRVVYAVPGWAWNTGVQFGGAIIRGISGILEFVPGVILIPFEADMDPLYDPAERGEALVDRGETFPVKFGINYTTIPY